MIPAKEGPHLMGDPIIIWLPGTYNGTDPCVDQLGDGYYFCGFYNPPWDTQAYCCPV